MSHTRGRTVYDSDSHLIESRGWLESYCTDDVRDNLSPGTFSLDLPQLDPIIEQADRRLAGDDPDMTEALKAIIFSHKGKYNQWMAYGAVDEAERSESLDIIGLGGQLVFPSIAASRFARSKDIEVVYGGCEALNRGMLDFCSEDERLLPVGCLSLKDPQRATATLKIAPDRGVRAVWIGSHAIDGRAPSHIAYDPIWALLGKSDTGLKQLSLKPSEYVRRQVRVAPLHTEDTGWILRNVGKDILMFNTDYPHPEGGRDPFGDFERSLDAAAATEEELDHFYTRNYEDYLGLAAA